MTIGDHRFVANRKWSLDTLDILGLQPCRKWMFRRPDDPRAAPEDQCWDLINEGTYIDGTATLEAAMPIFESSGARFIPVVTLSADAPPELLGALFHVDALKAYNRALAATAAEEHS